jgi:hypothetical protein
LTWDCAGPPVTTPMRRPSGACLRGEKRYMTEGYQRAYTRIRMKGMKRNQAENEHTLCILVSLCCSEQARAIAAHMQARNSAETLVSFKFLLVIGIYRTGEYSPSPMLIERSRDFNPEILPVCKLGHSCRQASIYRDCLLVMATTSWLTFLIRFLLISSRLIARTNVQWAPAARPVRDTTTSTGRRPHR